MSVIGFSVSQQAGAISQACATYSVPLQVFMGMYNNETTLGANVTSGGGGVGPFQFQQGTGNFQKYGYPQTNTPSLQEFQQQALAAAHLLSDLYNQLHHNWSFALGGYNGGARNYNIPVTAAYAAAALAFKIPGNWSAALGKGPGAAGGAVGAGGTGAGINDIAQFQVGDTSVPDEDFWTCANRLSQARYWYLFSDAEIVYLADGPDLMNQEPVADLNRLAHLERISHLDFTWDNTSWRYAATHHRRARIQRKSRLAKITSPVMANLNLISEIDEMRSGDVFKLSGCGPGDGRWLVGTTRRSIFQIISEIELVPALQPLSEAQLQSSVAGVGAASSNKGQVPVGSASVQKVQRAINAVLGTPYSQANHAGAIGQQPATIKSLGTDCSGFVSYLMGPSGLGIWTTAYATPAIPSAPSIQPGPGQSITLYNNPLPGNSGHVFIDINGTSYEEGGSQHNCHLMTASETQFYIKSGAFTALHPAGY